MFFTRCFPSATVILCYSQGQLPTADNSFGCVQSLVWKIFILRMFSACLKLFTLTSKFSFFGYSHVFCSSS